MQSNKNCKPDSIYTKLRTKLLDEGFAEHKADAILKQVMSSDDCKTMHGRWNESTDRYPPNLISALWILTQEAAVPWSDDNTPTYFLIEGMTFGETAKNRNRWNKNKRPQQKVPV